MSSIGLKRILEAILTNPQGKSFHIGEVSQNVLEELAALNPAYTSPNVMTTTHAAIQRKLKSGWSFEKTAKVFDDILNAKNLTGIPNKVGGNRIATEALWLPDKPTSIFAPTVPLLRGGIEIKTLHNDSFSNIMEHVRSQLSGGGTGALPISSLHRHISSGEASPQLSRFSAVNGQPTLEEILGPIFDKVKLGKKALPFAVGGAAGAGALGAASEASANTSGNSAGSRSDWLSGLLSGLMSGWTPNSASARASVSTPSRLSDRLPTNVPPLTFGSASGSSLGAASEASPEGFRVPRSQAGLRGGGTLPISSLHRNISYGGTGSQRPRFSAVKGQPELNEILGPIFDKVKLGKKALPFAVGGAAGTGALGAASEASAGTSAGELTGVPSVPALLDWDEWVASDRTTPEPGLKKPVFDPIDNIIALLTGPAGIAGKAAAGAMETPLSLALDAVLEGAGSGFDYLGKLQPQMPGAWF